MKLLDQQIKVTLLTNGRIAKKIHSVKLDKTPSMIPLAKLL